ncbi:MAG: NTP transferase domain-containing protein [Methanomicrobiales archaeon]|nr:NTP transferase domain-containing protein [Methanomicrobiales archaeon]
MYALILAGGKASRLCMGEKALVRLFNRPLLSYVIDSVLKANLSPCVVVTSYTPYTTNYCRIHDIPWICTDGKGYVEDIWQAVLDISISGPFLTICADLPGITAENITFVLDEYKRAKSSACSVWTPYILDIEHNCIKKIDDNKQELLGKPVGLNILRGDLYQENQDEIQILLDEPSLTLNINTQDELVFAERFFSSILKNP